MLGLAAMAACSSEGGVAPTTPGSTSTTSTGGGTGGAKATGGAGGAVNPGGAGGTTSAGGAGGEAPMPHTFTLSGLVVDADGNPVAGAIVLQGGAKAPAMTTGADGAYSIELTDAIPAVPAVVASKPGYRTAGAEFYELPAGSVDLVLRFVSAPDNEGYVYGAPGVGDPKLDNSTDYCGHCHTRMTADFQETGHRDATREGSVQDLYAGVSEAFADEASCKAAGGRWRAGLVPGTASDSTNKCYLGGGVLPDLNGCGGEGELACDDPALPPAKRPTAFGACADCHAPGIPGKAGGRNLHDAVGLAFDFGNHCDVCHHIADVDLTKPAGLGGAVKLGRPHDTLDGQIGGKLLQALYSPLVDVPNAFMGGVYTPKFATSELCGGCHEQRQPALLPGQSLDAKRWPQGLPVHTTYSEWKGSAYDAPDTQCQACHMPPDESGLKSTVDVTDGSNASITFGYVRPPEQIRQHTFVEALDGSPRLIEAALDASVSATTDGKTITAEVHIASQHAGHAIPTGDPIRHLVLVVRAEGCGASLDAVGGMTTNDVAGAIVEGMVGPDLTANGAVLAWKDAAARAGVGSVVRFVHPTGDYDDYAGVGFFADPALSPMEKGLEIRAPLGEAKVVAVDAGSLTLDHAVPVALGDVAYLGDPLGDPVDGSSSNAIAGVPGYTFAKVMVDADGQRLVHHYRAVDIASDNRIPTDRPAITTHVFAAPKGCATAKVKATLLYRGLPLMLARERGWLEDATDAVVVVATAEASVSLP